MQRDIPIHPARAESPVEQLRRVQRETATIEAARRADHARVIDPLEQIRRAHSVIAAARFVDPVARIKEQLARIERERQVLSRPRILG